MDVTFVNASDEDDKALLERESPPETCHLGSESFKRKKLKEEYGGSEEDERCWHWQKDDKDEKDEAHSSTLVASQSSPENALLAPSDESFVQIPWDYSDPNDDLTEDESLEDPYGEHHAQYSQSGSTGEVESSDCSSSVTVSTYYHPLIQALEDTEHDPDILFEFSTLKSFRWAHHQATQREHLGSLYRHKPFPPHEQIDVEVDPYMESLNRASRFADPTTRSREKQLAFHSLAPPVPGQSYYSPTFNGGSLNGMIHSKSRLTHFKPTVLRGEADIVSKWTRDWKGERRLSRPSFRPKQDLLHIEIKSERKRAVKASDPSRSALDPPSFIGAIATTSTSPNARNEIMFFTWKLADSKKGWHAGAIEYAGRRFADNPSRKPQQQQAERCTKKVEIVSLGKVSHTEPFGPLDGVIWLGPNELLVYGGEERPLLRRVALSIGALSIKTTSVRLVSLPCTRPIREIETSKDGKNILAASDDGSIIVCPIEQVVAGTSAEAKWTMEGAIGSVRWQDESVVTATNDVLGYAAFDKREPNSTRPFEHHFLDVPTYSHEHIAGTHIVVLGNSEGWLSLHDKRMMNAKIPMESLRDHSQCVFGDLRYDRATRTLSTFGSPSSSSWYYDEKGQMYNLGNSTIDNGLLTADHSVSGAPVPHSSLVCIASSTGKLALIDP